MTQTTTDYPATVRSTATARIDYARVPPDRRVTQISEDAKTGTWIARTEHSDGRFAEHVCAGSRARLIRRLWALAK